jgi:hypothetical protein
MRVETAAEVPKCQQGLIKRQALGYGRQEQLRALIERL